MSVGCISYAAFGNMSPGNLLTGFGYLAGHRGKHLRLRVSTPHQSTHAFASSNETFHRDTMCVWGGGAPEGGGTRQN